MQSSLGQYETVIRDEINRLNAIGEEDRQRKLLNGEDLLPNSDVGVWLRECKQEIVEPMQGETQGNIPDWLTGTLIRNGPGSLTVGEHSYNHLFDGPALLHRFYIKNGEGTYQSRFLRSNTYKKNQEAQRIVVSEFGTRAVPDPCKTIFQRFSSCFTFEEDSDNCLISVYPFKDEIYTLTETPVMHRIDLETLETLNRVNVSKVANVVHHTSHPHVEESGLVFNIGLSIQNKKPAYAVVEFPNTKKGIEKKDIFSEARLVAFVESRWPFQPSYMHSFGMTKSYYIIVEQPMCISVKEKIASNFNNKPLYKILKWKEKHPTLLHVLCRQTGKCLKTFLAEPFFYLHIINQYEENNHVVIDICVYKDPGMIECMLVEALKSAKQNPDYAKMFRGRPVRYVLPMAGNTNHQNNLVTLSNTKAKAHLTKDSKIFVIPELLCNLGCETPRINYPLFMGEKYTYFYGISSDVDMDEPGTLIKVDVVNKTRMTWAESEAYPSEPVFVPSPNGKDEDDGIVLSTLLWGKDETKVAVVVLDAKKFTELGRITFRAPTPVPKCLHGWYFPD